MINKYDRPPIIQAIVEFRSRQAFKNETKKKRAIKAFAKNYAEHQPKILKQITFELNPNGNPKAITTDIHEDLFTSEDITEQLQVKQSSFVIAQIAPYCGWDEFFGRVERDWRLWCDYISIIDLDRVGLRYINRIDIPMEDGSGTPGAYINIMPNLPAGSGTGGSYKLRTDSNLIDLDAHLVVQSSLAMSPIPNKLAINLDMDIGKQYKSTPDIEEVFNFLHQARRKKNEIFEACITDEARALFKI